MRINKKEIRTFLILFVICIITLLIGSPYTSPLNPYYGYDSAYFMIGGKALLHGKMLYQDLELTYGPLIFMIDALGFMIHNQKLGIFLLQILFMYSTLILIYKAYQLLTRKKSTVWCILLTFCAMYVGIICEGNMTEEWSMPFIFLSFYLTMKYIIQKRQEYPVTWGFLQGVIFSVIGLIRLNNAIVPCGLVISTSIILISEKKYKNLLKNAIAYIIGFLIPFGLMCTYFEVYGCLHQFIENVYLSGFNYAKAGLDEKGIKDYAIVFLRFIPVIFGQICAIRYLIINKGKLIYEKKQVCVVYIVTSLVSFPVLCVGYGWIHYYMIILPLILFVWIFAKENYCSINILTYKKNAVILSLVLIIIPYGYYIARNAGRDLILNFTDYYNTRIDEVQEVMSYIPEDEKENILVFDVLPQFYLYADIIPNYRLFTFQSFNIGINEKIAEEFYGQIDYSTPIWLVREGITDDTDYVIGNHIYTLYMRTDMGWNLGLYRLKE